MSAGTGSVRMTPSSRDETGMGALQRESTTLRRRGDHVKDVLSDPTLRVLCATENTTIASYRGTCVEMYAYCSLVTVSRFLHPPLNAVVG